MDDFRQLLLSWQMFYATIAAASATVAGLLFVALSINRERLDEHSRRFARVTFGNLVNVIVISLIFLVPHEQASGLSIALFAFGGVSLAGTLVETIVLLCRRVPFGGVARLFALPMALSAAMLLVALLIGRHFSAAMYWPIAIIVILLASACRNAWEILFND